MVVSKKSIFSIVLIGCIGLYSATAYWSGVKAEEALQQQYRVIKDSGVFTIVSHTYQRGWFNATATIQLTLNQANIQRYKDFLPDHLKSLLGQTIHLTQHIQHGPILYGRPFDLRWGRALVTTEFNISPTTRDLLAPFFGNREPIIITNHIRFNGEGMVQISGPSFDYRELLSGIRIQWQGFEIRLNYNNPLTEYQYTTTIPKLVLHIPNLSDITLENLHYLAQKHKNANNIFVHTSHLSIGRLLTLWQDTTTIGDQKKETGWLSHAQKIARFLNPIEKLSLTNLQSTHLHYRLTTEEINDFINTRGILGFDTLTLENKQYRAMQLDVIASHLHAPTLRTLWQKLKAAPPEKSTPASRQRYLAILKKYGTSLLFYQPKMVLRQFTLKTPQGIAKISGYIGLSPLSQTELDQKTNIFKHFNGKLRVNLPHDWLKDLAMAQIHHFLVTDTNNKKTLSATEMDNLIESLLNLQLQILNAQGYIEDDGQQLKTVVRLKEGQLRLNNKKIFLPWESMPK